MLETECVPDLMEGYADNPLGPYSVGRTMGTQAKRRNYRRGPVPVGDAEHAPVRVRRLRNRDVLIGDGHNEEIALMRREERVEDDSSSIAVARRVERRLR
jgi:hypothetical protein